jgi:hypothetical protein
MERRSFVGLFISLSNSVIEILQIWESYIKPTGCWFLQQTKFKLFVNSEQLWILAHKLI